ncbi:MAG: hypothetical protein ACRDOI_03945 [Trebonia sp.]
MSYEMFVQAFEHGGPARLPSSAFDVLRPHVDQEAPHHHFWHLRTPDGGEADIYADVTPGTFDSLMISHFTVGGPLDVLAEFATRAGAVILTPDGPALLTAEAQREHLPDIYRHDAVIVCNGDDIRRVLASI